MVNNYALHNVETLRFWCRKVLPLVYDDSLSYYEVLCKVVAKLNEVIDNEDAQNEVIKQLNENVETLAEAQTEQYNELLGMIDGAITSIGSLQTGKVDKAQSASDNGKVLGIVNGQVTPTEIQADNVFYATYNVTPFSEIYSAWDDDELVILSRVNQLGHYEHAVLSDISTTTATFIVPANPSDGSYEKITCTASGWDVETVQYSEGGVFYAEYQTTSFADITAAYEDGKTVILDQEGALSPLCYIGSDGAAFVSVGDFNVTFIYVDDSDTWSGETSNYSSVYEVDIVNPSFSDITNAYSEGKLCVVKMGEYVIPLSFIDSTVAIFTITGCDPDPHIGQLYVHSDNTITSDDTQLMPTNIGSTNAGKILVADDIGDLQAQRHFEVFPVTYGTTTFTEIAAALQNEMICVMVYNGECFVINSIDAQMGADFVCAKAGVTIICTCGTDNTWSYTYSAYVPTAQGVANAGKTLHVNASGNVEATEGLPYRTTAPTATNTNGMLIPVVLGESADPATKYDGYLYIIHEEPIT